MSKFWKILNKGEKAELRIEGDIEDSSDAEWLRLFGLECTDPKSLKAELEKIEGKDLDVWINSYGGNTVAASLIYTQLSTRKGNTTVKIDGVACSAASVIAMAGQKVLMSQTAVMMIHNPSTFAYGDHNEMSKTIELLNEVKESIVNAYEKKTKLSREKIHQLMEEETWMALNKAIELGFCDGEIPAEDKKDIIHNLLQEKRAVYNKKVPSFKDINIVKPNEEEIAKQKTILSFNKNKFLWR